MKKILLLTILAFSSVAVYSQQRLCLLEEFTQASCGPCAAQNPALNTLLAANSSKVVSIKYQTDWPGVDPMNAQNPTEVDVRVAYYSVTGVPDIEFDGNVIAGGAPSALTTAGINAEYAVASDFNIALSHSFNATWDSVYITCNVNAINAVTGTLKLHVAMVEKTISFLSPPGSNGETEFYSIMRKMYPNASGTTLPTTMPAGSSQLVTFAAKVPTYIYNKNEIAIIAFVQDDATKNVKQAAISEPIPVSNDANITSGQAIGLTCAANVTPTFAVNNPMTVPMTSCVINYTLDGGSPMTQNWTGSLAPGATTNVTLAAISNTSGTHSVTSSITQVNGNPDLNLVAPVTLKYYTPFASSIAPISQDFVSTVYPPTNCMEQDDPLMMTRFAVGVGGSNGSVKYDFYNIAAGSSYFYPPTGDFRGYNHAYITFKHAHADYDATYGDTLTVEVSNNCGATWSEVYRLGGAALNTAAASTAAFAVNAASVWALDSIALDAYANTDNVLIRIKGGSGFSNNMFVDNINVKVWGPTSVDESNMVSNMIELYPNPATTTLQINTNELLVEKIDVIDATGRMIDVQFNKGMINIQDLAKGMYTLRIITDKGVGLKTFVKE